MSNHARNKKRLRLRRDLVQGRSQRGTFGKAPRRGLSHTTVFGFSTKNDKAGFPGPGDYYLRDKKGIINRSKGKSFGYKEYDENIETRISFNRRNQSMESSEKDLMNYSQSFRKKPKPGPTSYNPSYSQVWPKSSRYGYQKSVSQVHSRMKKANEILEKRISSMPKRTKNEGVKPSRSRKSSQTSSMISSSQENSTLRARSIKKKSRKKKNLGTFGTAPKFGMKSQRKANLEKNPTPGPGAYHTDQETISRRVELEIGAGARLLGKLREIYENGIPGPGTYSNLDLNLIRKFDAGYKMSKGEKDTSLIDHHIKKNPGPGYYNLTYFPVRTRSLGYSPEKNKKHANSSGVTSMDKQILRYGKNKIESSSDKVIDSDYNIQAKRYRMGAGISFPRAEKKTANAINMKKNKKNVKEKYDQSEIVEKDNEIKKKLEKWDGNPGPGFYNVRQVYEKYFSKPGKSILKRKAVWHEEEQRSKRDFPGPGEYNIPRELDNQEYYKPSEPYGSKADIINGIDLEESEIALEKEGHSNFDMRIFEGLRTDKLIDINTLANYRNMKEKKKGMLKGNLKTLAEMAEKGKQEQNQNRMKKKKFKMGKRRRSGYNVFQETENSHNDLTLDEKNGKFSASQIRHMKAQSFVQDQRDSKEEVIRQKRNKRKQPGASFGNAVRPIMKKRKKPTPGPGEYDIRGSIGNGPAVGWGKMKMSDLEKLQEKILQEFGNVGPATYEVLPTFPQVQDWERWKLENKNF